MRTSISMTNVSWSIGTAIDAELTSIARAADEIGIDSLFVSDDHLLQVEPGTQLSDPMLEAYTLLGYLAAQTSRMRLGSLVTPTTLRPPALLVKVVTTLDVLSRGRAWFGVGAGYHEEEAVSMGLPFGSTSERYEWLEDTLQLATQMWDGNEARFSGRRIRADRLISSPVPISSPHPPILIGGTGEKRTLRLVARYADACNLPDMPDGGETIRRKLAVLADHCQVEQRSFDLIQKTVSTRLNQGETSAAFVERARTLSTYGIDHLIVFTQGPWTLEELAVLADAVTPIANIQVA